MFLVLTAATAPPVSALPPLPAVAAAEAAHWRFAGVRRSLPRAQVIQDEQLETENWREFAYAAGALRVYVSREGDNVIAILADTSHPPYSDFGQLHDTSGYTVHVAEPYVVVMPTHAINERSFNRLKAKTWSAKELKRVLGPPSYRSFSHGVGSMTLNYVPEGLCFVNDSYKQPRYEWYYLYDWREPLGEDDLFLRRGTDVPYESYVHDVRRVATELATRLCDDRRQISEALAGGTASPSGRFVVAPINVVGTRNSQQTVIGERDKPERRYGVGSFTEQKSYRWVDQRTVLYKVEKVDGLVEFYTLDAINGAQAKVAELPNTVPAQVTFGITSRRRFWYVAADGVRHEVVLRRSAVRNPSPR